MESPIATHSPQQDVDHRGDAQVLAKAGDGRPDEGHPTHLREDLRLRLQVGLQVGEDGHGGHSGRAYGAAGDKEDLNYSK